jgi:uncharacterized heparinase superfamily protein
MRLIYSVIYTDIRLLFWRLLLILKRHIYQLGLGHLGFRLRVKHSDNFKIGGLYSTNPIFPPRSGRLMKTGAVINIQFLNETKSFVPPIDWHLPELNLGTRLWKLNLHYHEYLESVDDELFASITNDWIDNNPMYEKDYWKDSWNSYSLSIRVVVWMQQYSKRKSSLSEEFKIKFCDSLYKQLTFLLDNIENDIRGNHIIKNIKALLFGSRFFSQEGFSNHLYFKGMKLLRRELQKQILKDGMHFELSPSYHAQVLSDLLEIYSLEIPEVNDTFFREKIKRMFDALSWVIHNDESIAQFNDGGLHMTYSYREIKAVFDSFFPGIIPSIGYFGLRDSGYYGFRDENETFIYKAGRIADDSLPAHGHGDIFSFEWSFNGSKIFIDKGTYEYNAGLRRDISRATKSHNTISFEGIDQAQFYSSFRVGLRPKVEVEERNEGIKGLHIVGRHNGFKLQGLKTYHKRQLEYKANFGLTITDYVDDLNFSPRFNLLIPSSVKVNLTDVKSCTIRTKNSILCLNTEGDIRLTKSTYFPDFGVEEPCSKISIKLKSNKMKTSIHMVS